MGTGRCHIPGPPTPLPSACAPALPPAEQHGKRRVKQHGSRGSAPLTGGGTDPGTPPQPCPSPPPSPAPLRSPRGCPQRGAPTWAPPARRHPKAAGTATTHGEGGSHRGTPRPPDPRTPPARRPTPRGTPGSGKGPRRSPPRDAGRMRPGVPSRAAGGVGASGGVSERRPASCRGTGIFWSPFFSPPLPAGPSLLAARARPGAGPAMG